MGRAATRCRRRGPGDAAPQGTATAWRGRNRSICVPSSTTCSGGIRKWVGALVAFLARNAKSPSLVAPILPAPVARAMHSSASAQFTAGT